MTWWRPKEDLESTDVERGLRLLIYDGMCSQVMGVLTGGAFLVAFALLLGASNKTIGLLAALAPMTQVLQIPAIFLVDRLKRRKLLVTVNVFIGRLFLLGIAGIPWFVPAGLRVKMLVLSLIAYYALGAIAGVSWSSWIRDLVPEARMGTYFARRMAIATALGAALSLIAGGGVDWFTNQGGDRLTAYAVLFVIGAGAGLLGTIFLARTPEPRMQSTSNKGLLTTLAEPFQHENFRRLLFFLGSWNFAINLAAPFFTVYLLKRLGMSMTWVVGLAVLSQFTNVLFFRIWGRMADRFTNKSVLTVSGPLFVISILLWPFTTMPDAYALTIPLIIFIHLLAGMSTAGVALCSGNMAMKAAPRGRATAFLAVNGLVNGLAASVAPILAGATADWFELRQLSFTISWHAPGQQFMLPAFDVKGLDFIFLISVVMGLYALHRLLAVKEEGEVAEKIVRGALVVEMREILRSVTNVGGLMQLSYFPFGRLKRLITQPKKADKEGDA